MDPKFGLHEPRFFAIQQIPTCVDDMREIWRDSPAHPVILKTMYGMVWYVVGFIYD